MKLHLLPVLLLACLSLTLHAAEDDKARIDAAITRVETSGLTFIRNGAEHAAKDAADHLRYKLRSAGDRVKTFDDFITHVATKSSLSGKPYLVKLANGTTTELAKWLRE